MPSGALEYPDISHIYARFIALKAFVSDSSGSFFLYKRLNSDGLTVAIASNIAGAASLGVEPGAERAKAALRGGVCDFVVNNLDEALRILKNEIRKRRGVSVVLTAKPEAMVGEMIERGVQPDVLAFPVPELMERGARLLAAGKEDGLTSIAWSVERDGPQWLPALDRLAAASLPANDARRRWIELAPRYLGRSFAGQRYVRMSADEAEAFVSAVHQAAIPAPVMIQRGGEKLLILP